MKCSVFSFMASPAILSHRSFGMAFCALPFLLMLMLSLSFAAGQAGAQCGKLVGPSTTWSDGTGSWSVAGNWTSGTPDASTNACILDGTSTVSVTLGTNGNAEGLQLASGNGLNIGAGASLSLVSGASFNSGTITNSGTFNNTAGANLANSGTLNNIGGTLYIDSSSTLTNSSILDNAAGASLTNAGTINNDGSLINSGQLTNGGTINNSGANLSNFGTITNSGDLNISSALTNIGTITNSGGSLIYGNFTAGGVYIGSTSTLANYGGITNTCGSCQSSSLAFFTHARTPHNYSTLTNGSGLFIGDPPNTNSILNNSGTITNYGTLYNIYAGNFNNYGQLTNSGTIVNSTGFAAIENYGTITNNSGAILTSSYLAGHISDRSRLTPDLSRNRKLSVSFRQMHSSGVQPNQSVFLAPSIKNMAKSVARGLAASCRIISAT